MHISHEILPRSPDRRTSGKLRALDGYKKYDIQVAMLIKMMNKRLSKTMGK